MSKLLRLTLLAVAGYAVWRIARDQTERSGGVGPAIEQARERVAAAVAEGQRVAAATRAELEAQAGRALRDEDDDAAGDDADADAIPPAPWPPAPMGSASPV
jgi:hypothetical protein